MTLADILEQLQYGELTHLGIGDLSVDENRKRVVAQINLGLLELHKRFYLIAKQVLLETQEDVYEYYLNEVLSASNNLDATPHNYLDSFNSIYNNDLLKVERIFNEDNEELPLNSDNEESSFFTPQYNIIRVPLDYPPKNAIVEYRAYPEKLNGEVLNECEEQSIPLPIALMEPLLLFTGFRLSRILNSDGNQETMSYFQLYEEACKRIENMGYQITFRRTNDKLDIRGWV